MLLTISNPSKVERLSRSTVAYFSTCQHEIRVFFTYLKYLQNKKRKFALECCIRATYVGSVLSQSMSAQRKHAHTGGSIDSIFSKRGWRPLLIFSICTNRPLDSKNHFCHSVATLKQNPIRSDPIDSQFVIFSVCFALKNTLWTLIRVCRWALRNLADIRVHSSYRVWLNSKVGVSKVGLHKHSDSKKVVSSIAF